MGSISVPKRKNHLASIRRCCPLHYDALIMSGGDAVPIIGGFIVINWTILLSFFFIWRHRQNKEIHRAQGVKKVLIATHGTKSWDQIEREFTYDYAAGVRPDAVLDLIADAYKDDTVESLEATNPHAGAYNPKSPIQNADSLSKYFETRDQRGDFVAQRKVFLDKQSTALACASVLNLIRQGTLKRVEHKEVQ